MNRNDKRFKYIDLAWAKSESLDNNYSLLKQNIKSCNDKGDVTRYDSRRRFLTQHSVAVLEQCCNNSKQCRNNVATLCCAKNRCCKSSRVTSL